MTTSTLGLPDAIVGELMLGEVGTNPSPTVLSRGTYGVLIDWNGDGTFVGTYDILTDDVRNNPGIQIQRGKDSVRPRSPAMVPSASFVLGNVHRRYSAENSGSPLFGLIAPDKPARIDLIDVLTTALITGAIDEPEQMPDRTERSVGIQMLGKTAVLKGREISTMLYQEIRTDEAVTIILDAVGWPSTDRVIASGDTVMHFWWLDNEDAWDALMDLLETEGTGASIYEDGAGKLHFENRNFRDMATRATLSQGTFLDTAADAALAYQRFNYVPMMREIFNTVRIRTVERALTAVGSVWDNGEPIVLSAGESRTLFVEVDQPITNVQPVLAVADYMVVSGYVAASATLQLNANKVLQIFTAGAAGAVIVGPDSNPTSGPQMRAQAAQVVNELDVSVTSIGSTVTRPKTLSLTDGIRREISPSYAESLCNVALAFYKEARPAISIEFMNASTARLAQIGTREVSDRITVVEPITGVNRDIHIEQVNHQIDVGGRDHKCALIGSAAPTVVAPGLWGVTTNGGWGTAKWAD